MTQMSVKRTDRIRNPTLRSKRGIIDIGQKAARLKWDWVGHVSRKHPHRWVNVSTHTPGVEDAAETGTEKGDEMT